MFEKDIEFAAFLLPMTNWTLTAEWEPQIPQILNFDFILKI